MAVEELLLPESPVYELVLRAVVIYFALMLAFRLIGKHEFGQTTPFDLILLLIISESISTALNVNDTSITAGLIVMSTLFALNYLMSWDQFKSRTLKRILSGEAEVLIRDGRPDPRLMKRERITRDDIDSSLRTKGIDGMEEGAPRVSRGGRINLGAARARTDTRAAPGGRDRGERREVVRNVGSVRFELTIDGSLRCASVLQRVITIQKTHCSSPARDRWSPSPFRTRPRPRCSI